LHIFASRIRAARSGVMLAAVVAGLILTAGVAHAGPSAERTGPAGVGASQNAEPNAVRIPGVRQRVEPPAEAPGGGIYVTIDSAEVHGNPSDPPSLYCSINVSVFNFLPSQVADLVVLIDFTAPDGGTGGTLSVFHSLAPGSGELDQFNQLPLHSCAGLAGKLKSVLCRTIQNDDCNARVLGMRAGAVALQ
jgi:hypothetical protein